MIFLVTSKGDVTYNPRRNFLAAMCVERKIAYHLFTIDANPVKTPVSLCRKAKWHPQYDSIQGSVLLFSSLPHPSKIFHNIS